MLTGVPILLLLLFAHFLGDFVLQDDRMAKQKSESWWVLLIHCVVMSGPLALAGLLSDNLSDVTLLVVANAVIHFVIDAVTSRITKYFYLKGDRHNFFVTIGADQFLHTATIVLLWDQLRL